MIAGHGVVQRLPQPLNHVDPRVIDGLEEQLELRVVDQPPPGEGTLVHDEVVHDEHDPPCPAMESVRLCVGPDEGTSIHRGAKPEGWNLRFFPQYEPAVQLFPDAALFTCQRTHSER